MNYSQVEPDIDQDDIEKVVDYLNSGGWITEHSETRELENNLKSFVGRNHAAAVPNGTIAIYLSLLALGLEGKKIAVPNITMIATINAIIWANSTPVLIDVNENMCMSLEKLQLHKDVDAVIYVPLNGRTSEGLDIQDWCYKNKVKLIEDSAHALGSSYGKISCGNLGDASVLSFTPHKIITMGQGGMVLSNNNLIHDFINDIKTFNRSKDAEDWHKGFGLNFKITDLQAALGLAQYKKLEKYIANKKRNHKLYEKYITNKNIEVLNFKDYEVPWFFDVKIESEDYKKYLTSELKKRGVQTRNLYPALSKQDYLMKFNHGNLDYSENNYNKIIWLPSSNSLKEEDIIQISELINSL